MLQTWSQKSTVMYICIEKPYRVQEWVPPISNEWSCQ
jgi:hypothetical protein